MEAIVWCGTPLRVIVAKAQMSAPSGRWEKAESVRDVYAIGYQGGTNKVLVADDDGKLQWIAPDHYKVTGEAQVIPRRRSRT